MDDIDLFVGAMMEKVSPGSLFGPTFQCLITEQFKRWRNGDRYYYDFGGLPGSFTKSNESFYFAPYLDYFVTLVEIIKL